MIRLAADEDFNYHIVRGVLRRNPKVDFVRVQDAELSGADDETILEWAATAKCVLFTHDQSTMAGFAWNRVKSGQPMAGLFEVSRLLSIGHAIVSVQLSAISDQVQERPAPAFCKICFCAVVMLRHYGSAVFAEDTIGQGPVDGRGDNRKKVDAAPVGGDRNLRIPPLHHALVHLAIISFRRTAVACSFARRFRLSVCIVVLARGF